MKNCNCIKEVADLIEQRIHKQKENTEGYRILETEWENKSWYPEERLYTNFKVKSSFTKKDGSESKPINEHVRIFFTYCPFCGKEYTTNDKRAINILNKEK